MTALRSHRGLRWLAMGLIIAWPLLISAGIAYHSLKWLLPLLALVLLLRAWQTPRRAGPMRVITLITALAGSVLCAASWVLNAQHWLLWYPVVINLVMLLVFGGSLWSSMPLVERIARLREPHLSPHAIRYTRNVTRVWSLFFIVNGSIALGTVLRGDMTLWSAWNGVISYILIGLLMTGEWIVRQQVKKRESL